MKKIGYIVFAVVFYICRLFPISNKKIFLVMTHDAGPEGNVAVVRDYLEAKKKDYRFHSLVRTDTIFGKNVIKVFRFFFETPFHMATSAFIFMDNIFLPMGYMTFSKKTKVVQLWHGTGTIKRFGQSVNEGSLRKLEAHANKVTTHLVVNGTGICKQYSECFGIDADRILATGMPRTDVFFDETKREKMRQNFYQTYPECAGKHLVLYAPTFRDGKENAPDIVFDYKRISQELGSDYVIGLRLHPFVSKSFQIEDEFSTQIIDFSQYDSLNSLLFATDILITDYSSVVFEYAVLDRPMLFYAYDLEEFSDSGRGFYHDYRSYVPGKVVTSNDEIIESIEKKCFDKTRTEHFIEESYTYQDGKSTKRLIEELKM